ncbi:MAG: hypothetical protein KJ941_03575, partial [Bacteroidetes bacterium]|nr:hypothetical protein [Bacteroidota bacterium]
MCTPTKQIKLCTCPTAEKPKNNYWVLLTKINFEESIVGIVSINFRSTEKSYIQIHKELEQQLNAQYPFDKPIELKEEDILKIKIPTDGHPKGEIFSFMFSNSKWETFVSDSLTEYDYE